jgi:hypothetical protein
MLGWLAKAFADRNNDPDLRTRGTRVADACGDVPERPPPDRRGARQAKAPRNPAGFGIPSRRAGTGIRLVIKGSPLAAEAV